MNDFINNFDKKIFGINYDSGNSASLGFDPDKEFNEYGNRIINIHIKDREVHGTTLRLGLGNTNFKKVFNNIEKLNIKGT